MKSLGRDGLAKIDLQTNPVFLFRLEFRREVTRAAAPGVLRLIEREIRLEDEIIDGGSVDRAEGAANRHTNANFGLVDHIGFADRLDDAVGEYLHQLAA